MPRPAPDLLVIHDIFLFLARESPKCSMRYAIFYKDWGKRANQRGATGAIDHGGSCDRVRREAG